MKITKYLLAELVEPDVYEAILAELEELKGRKIRTYIELADLREVLGDGAYRKLILNKLNVC